MMAFKEMETKAEEARKNGMLATVPSKTRNGIALMVPAPKMERRKGSEFTFIGKYASAEAEKALLKPEDDGTAEKFRKLVRTAL
ncbi:MAG: hypothetical protein ACP5NX_04495 [Candidatus Bilamarchaeaceae archaeon]